MKTVVGLFDELSDARNAVNDLVDAGFDRGDISLVAGDSDRSYSTYLEGSEETSEAAEGAVAGALGGGVIGGLAGVLLGLGALAIPGIGPVVAAGPIVAGLTGAGLGAVTGGLLGALVGWGIPEEEAEFYAEGVRRGGILVAAKAMDHRVDEAVAIMNRHNPVDIERRSATWRASGWTGYDVESEPLTTSEAMADRNRYGYGTYMGDTYDTYEPAFRRHYTSSLVNTGHDYSWYEPGYHYGYTLATDERYRDYDSWVEIEHEARLGWERTKGAARGTWEEFKDAVRYGWNEVKEAVR